MKWGLKSYVHVGQRISTVSTYHRSEIEQLRGLQLGGPGTIRVPFRLVQRKRNVDILGDRHSFRGVLYV
jgi:hypothetical protein